MQSISCNIQALSQGLMAISNNMLLNSLLSVFFVNIIRCSAKSNVFLVETKPSTKTSIQYMEGPTQRKGNFCLFFSPKILFQALTKLWPRSTRWVDSQSMQCQCIFVLQINNWNKPKSDKHEYWYVYSNIKKTKQCKRFPDWSERTENE